MKPALRLRVAASAAWTCSGLSMMGTATRGTGGRPRWTTRMSWSCTHLQHLPCCPNAPDPNAGGSDTERAEGPARTSQPDPCGGPRATLDLAQVHGWQIG